MGVELPLRVVVTILECCVTFPGVKLSIRSFVLFWQVDMVEFLINERKLLTMKLDYICSHLSTAFNSKKLFNALPQGMASTIKTTLPHKMARGIRTVWQNLAFKDRIRMAYQGDFRSSKALLTNQELRLKQQRQQIVDGLH